MNGLTSTTTAGHHSQVNGTVSAVKELPTTPQLSPPHYPAHFVKGSVIELANGDLRRVEDLTTEDFVRSADASADLCLDSSTVLSLTPLPERGTVMVELSIGHRNVRISVESTMEHPFFVYNRGWSSFSPSRTSQRYELLCSQLEVGDRCISLTQKSSDVKHSAGYNAMGTDLKSSGPLLNVFPNSNGSSSVMHNRTRLASDSVVHVHGKY